MLKLHLGCGSLSLDKYVNIDISSECADLKANIDNLSHFGDGTVNEIYCCHVFEHIRRSELVGTLVEWNRVLSDKGELRLSVPDFEKVVKIYQNNGDMSEVVGFLNGGQRDDHDIHFVNFDFSILSELLEACGFSDIGKYDQDEFLGERDDYSKCYLPHMDKAGELMSINVICRKNKDVSLSDISLSKRLRKYLKMGM